MSRLAKLRVLARLGPEAVARVGLYQLGLKTGLHPVLRLKAPVAEPPFLRPTPARPEAPPPNAAWDKDLWSFGWRRRPFGEKPIDWFENPFSDQKQPDAARPWFQIPDFGAGDIKGVWEASRFDWLTAWATQAAHGDAAALDRINLWLADWARRNPPYQGPNWKCGQEAAIRVMHLAAAAWILGQDDRPEAGLIGLLRAHLQRIAPTMSYAIGQRNNHATSEAAALFIGGGLLAGADPRAEGWVETGRRGLESLAPTLISPDGAFSQYSVTYHRLMLDTFSLAEAWRRRRGLPPFSGRTLERLAAAARWLEHMVDRESGDAPNLGANDGARILQFSDGGYRDFRPSVQLASALFRGRDAYGAGPWNAPLRWLSAPEGRPGEAPGDATFDDGGYHVLRRGRAMAMLRYPRFRFRPSQADALHLDLWAAGRNLLRDGGSYSYNAPEGAWFAGAAAHNTVEFDGRDQMPRLGRFLFGDWLEAERVEPVRETAEGVGAAAGYTDRLGARHHRRIVLQENGLTCADEIGGSFKIARLRWRLAPGDWALEGLTLKGPGARLEIESDVPPLSVDLGATQESRFYQQRSETPLLTVVLDRPASVVTKVRF